MHEAPFFAAVRQFRRGESHNDADNRCKNKTENQCPSKSDLSAASNQSNSYGHEAPGNYTQYDREGIHITIIF